MTPADRVRLLGMRFRGRHGVEEEERREAQLLEVDLELAIDCAPAACTDDLANAVDYDRLYQTCEEIVTNRSFKLLESLAHACLNAVFEDPRIVRATIRVRKPSRLNGATPEVELTRHKRVSGA